MGWCLKTRVCGQHNQLDIEFNIKESNLSIMSITAIQAPDDLVKTYEHVPYPEREEVVKSQVVLRDQLEKLTNTRPDDASTYGRYAAQVIADTPGLELPEDFNADELPKLRPEVLQYYHQLLESGTMSQLLTEHECKPGNHIWIPIVPIFPVTVECHDSNDSHHECKPTTQKPYWAYDVLIGEASGRDGVDRHRTKANMPEGASIFGLYPQTGSVRVMSPKGNNEGTRQLFFTNGVWSSKNCNDLVHPGMVISDSYSYQAMFGETQNAGDNHCSNYPRHHEIWIGGRCGIEAPPVEVAQH